MYAWIGLSITAGNTAASMMDGWLRDPWPETVFVSFCLCLKLQYERIACDLGVDSLKWFLSARGPQQQRSPPVRGQRAAALSVVFTTQSCSVATDSTVAGQREGSSSYFRSLLAQHFLRKCSRCFAFFTTAEKLSNFQDTWDFAAPGNR